MVLEQIKKETTEPERITLDQVKKIGVDWLKGIYMIMNEKMITETEALTYDWTEVFYHALIDKIKKGELIRIQIRGEVRTGKSTVGLKIKQEINKTLTLLKKNTDKIDEVETTLSDQTEFLRFIMQKIKHLCVQIDEYNAMAEGGANSTTETQILQAYGDIFASRYIHVINCNPTQIRDTNSFIHLEIIGKGEGYTRCKLRYCDNIGNEILTIGYVDIYVMDIIENWEQNIRPIFEKQKRTQKDEEYIQEQAKKDWYVRYQIKKEKRQDLLQINHVRDIRDLEFSEVVIDTYKDLQDIAEIDDIKNEVITSTISDVCREKGRIYSMYAELIVLGKVKSLITLQRQKTKYSDQIKQNYIKEQKNKLGTTKTKLKTLTKEEKEALIRAYYKYQEKYNKRIQEEEKLKKLYYEYVNIKG